MDTGSRTWDHEVIPAERIERALDDALAWLGELGAHHILHGPDPDALPDRDFSANSWQCRSCPFLDICLPGAAEDDGADEDPEIEHVSDEEARGGRGGLLGGPGRRQGALTRASARRWTP